MWYIGMEVGGTHIDCVALSTNGARSEMHAVQNATVTPEESVVDVVKEFMKDLSITGKDLKLVVVGWKHGRHKERSIAMMQQFAKSRLAAKVLWDAETAFAGALPEQVGILVQSGTGSVVYGRTAKGRVMSSGGWSPLLGDPGSAFAIGQQALISALRAMDGSGEKTLLSEAIPHETKSTLEQLVVLADAHMSGAVPKIAALCKVVFQLAEGGDTECIRIRDEAAKQLSERLASLLKLWPDKGPVLVSFSGRLMYAQSQFRQAMHSHLREYTSTIEWREPHFRPPYGALLAGAPKLLSVLEQADQSLDWHHSSN